MSSKQLFSHGSVAHSQATLGATGFFEANTCQLTYSSAYDGVSEKCEKKHLQTVFLESKRPLLAWAQVSEQCQPARRITLPQLICQLWPKESHMIKKKKTNTVQFLWEGIVWFIRLIPSLLSLPSLRRARVIKYKQLINHRAFIDSQRKRVVVGEEENRRFLFFFLELRAFVARSLSSARFARRCFRKERKEK